MGKGIIADGLLQRGYWALCAVFTVNGRGKRDVKGAGRALSLKMRTLEVTGALHEGECSGGSACAEGGGGENGLKFFFFRFLLCHCAGFAIALWHSTIQQ